MKTPVMLSLDIEAAQILRETADKIGASYSDLAGLLIRGGLATVPEGRLRAWAATRRTAPRASGKPSEEKALSGVTSEWVELREIQKKTGQGNKVLFRALTALQARGLIEGVNKTPGVMVRGIPSWSLWRLSCSHGDGV